jgi:predicted permease
MAAPGWSRLSSLWRNLAHRARVDRDLDDELQAAFDLAADEKMRAGLSPEAARRAATLELGQLQTIKQQVRDARTGAWLDTILQDARYGLRRLRRDPLFTVFAVVSLALGIGANTAIFSLWNAVLHSPLPDVHAPRELVMLSNPDSSGMWTGRWDGRTAGPRSWLTHDEFEQLRDHAPSFTALMASQCSLLSWQVRLEGGAPEEASGRLVSDEYFQVLGARPAIGRLFATGDDRPETLPVVISHDYWQRRFSGRPDVLGRTLTLRQAALVIVGVTSPRFIGETAGQRPDLWLPMRAQPLVLPGRDWLRDAPPDKVMWLHVFGRLRPGVSPAQAEAEANAVFRSGLESFYGVAASDPRRRDLLEQRLQLRPASRGASSRRPDFSQSLTALLAAVGTLLLITCANLSTLLLARGTARRPEIALRLSLGATRGRLIRQLLTESLAVAAAGGVAALAVASALHGVMTSMLARSDPDFRVGFSLDPLVLAFLAAATLVAAVLFGLLPAWQVTTTEAGAGLKQESRGAVGWAGQQRSSRSLVSLQLALSLPLLVGAGLLVRTVQNLTHADLGFPTERLLLVRVDFRERGYDPARRDVALIELLRELRGLPSVRAVSFSQLGLFTGGESGSTIDVEGHTARGDDDRASALDVVGPRYFSTLGIPILQGREILDGDRGSGDESCVVNEGFVRRFFDGRDPLGRRITSVEDGQPGKSCRVVGVSHDARTQGLREAVEPRYFVAGHQSLPQVKSPTFLIRVAPGATSAMAEVRKSIERVDAALPILSASSLHEQTAPYTAQDRTTAQLAVVFGGVALALAAIGLYGVLSYGVARRTREIAIRIALGARPGGVVAMILRETTPLVGAGLAAGLALTHAAARLVDSRLYGVAPRDPLTLGAAVALLLLATLFAAYWPAQRASRLDPMSALRQE